MGKEKVILIIDNEEDLRDTLEYLFKSGGFKVFTAVDGLDGLEKLKTVRPDLIILDMNMPRMNGLEFYQKITGLDTKPPYPVLVLTARANMEQLFRDLDVDGFMAKPFELDQICKEAGALIRKNSGLIKKARGSEEMRARRVCIVENNKGVLDKLAVAFLEEGYLVDAAHSGAAALKRISMDVPDVVVICRELPDISGDIVIGKLKRSEKTWNVQFLLYSEKFADVDKTIITKKISEKEGISRYVESIEPDVLIEAADELFQ